MANPAQPVERNVRFPDCTMNGLLVTPLGDGLYRMEESALLDWGDDVSELHSVIRCKDHPDGLIEFVEVVQPSPWKLHFRGLTRAIAESPELARWLETIQARGWHWERLFVGMLLVHAAPDTDVDVQAELDAVCRSVAGA